MLCSQHVAPAQEQRSLGDWYFLQRTAPRTARAPPLTRPPPKEERLEILLKYGCLINREENSFTRLPLSTLTDGSPRSPPPPSPFPHAALPLRRAYSLRDPVAFTSLVLKQDKSSVSLRFSRRRPAPRLPSPYLRAESQERERGREIGSPYLRPHWRQEPFHFGGILMPVALLSKLLPPCAVLKHPARKEPCRRRPSLPTPWWPRHCRPV